MCANLHPAPSTLGGWSTQELCHPWFLAIFDVHSIPLCKMNMSQCVNNLPKVSFVTWILPQRFIMTFILHNRIISPFKTDKHGGFARRVLEIDIRGIEKSYSRFWVGLIWFLGTVQPKINKINPGTRISAVNKGRCSSRRMIQYVLLCGCPSWRTWSPLSFPQGISVRRIFDASC